jgi:phosphoribosylanthranilate isomerase
MNRVCVKICGVTNVEDARAAAELGADAVGLNFHPASPRCVSLETARAIIDVLPPSVQPVGVVTDLPTMAEVAKRLSLRMLQWHGPLTALEDLPPLTLPAYPRIIAMRVASRDDVLLAETWLRRWRYRGHPAPDGLLIDGYHRDLLGGSGQTVPWDILSGFNPGVAVILAGGLTPENVAEAVRIVRPATVDVASGVESAPGKKDVEKMRRFIDNARSALG